MHKLVCAHMFSSFLGKYQAVGLLLTWEGCVHLHERQSNFSKMGYRLPLAPVDGSRSSPSLSTLSTVSLFHFSHVHRCTVASCREVNLHFPTDVGIISCADGLLCIFFDTVFVQIFFNRPVMPSKGLPGIRAN